MLDLCDIFNLECLVKKPTRVTPTSKTLIDTMWSLPVTKVEFLSTSTLEPHISDHRLIYTVMKISLARKRSREVICRSYHESIWYKHDLYETWLLCLFTLLHKSLMILMTRPFSKLFLEIANEHAPIKQFHIRGGQVPYMTPEWRRAIRHRNRLWNKYRNLKTEIGWSAYKRQRKLCTSLRRKTITS